MGRSQALQRFARQSKMYLKHNSSTILTIASAVGTVVTVIMAVKETPKALKLIEDAQYEKGEPLTAIEKVKVAGPVYIPSAVVGAGTVACMFGANVLNRRQQAALTSAYALIDGSYKEYKSKLKELYGEEVHNNVVDSIVKENCSKTYLRSPGFFSNISLEPEEGDEGEVRLFYDDYSKRYFETTMEKVLQAEYHLNRNFSIGFGVPVNEFYSFLGLCPIEGGDEVGWTMADGINWIDFNHRKVHIDSGLDCYVIEMEFSPMADYLDY